MNFFIVIMAFTFSFSGDPPPGGFSYNTRIQFSSKYTPNLLHLSRSLPPRSWVICPTYQETSESGQWNRGGDTELGMGGSMNSNDDHFYSAIVRETAEEFRAIPLYPFRYHGYSKLPNRARITHLFDINVSSLQTIPNWQKSYQISDLTNNLDKVATLVHDSRENCFDFLVNHTSNASCQDVNTSFQNDHIMGLTMIPLDLLQAGLIDLEARQNTENRNRFAWFDVETCTRISID